MSRADQLSVRISSEDLAEVVDLYAAEDDLEDVAPRPQTLVMLSGGAEPAAAAEPEQLALSLFLLMPGGEA